MTTICVNHDIWWIMREDGEVKLCGRDLQNNEAYGEIELDEYLDEDYFYHMVLHEDGEHAIIWQ
jgi:hypothetical protein